MFRKSLIQLLLFLVFDLLCFLCLLAAEDLVIFNDDVGVLNVTTSGSNRSKEDSFAGMLDRALEKEFPENDEQSDGTDPGSFNNSVAGQQAILETVARVKSKRNDSKEEKSFQLHDVFNLDNENGPEDTPRLIDSKVLKFLMENNSISTLYGQVTVGTLILQDCAVGLLFALLPILGGTSGILEGMLSMTKTLVTLLTFLAVLSVLSRTCIPWFLNLMISLSSQTNELYQLASVAFCLIVASCSDKLGLSLELGSFAAGVMISTTDLAQHTLEQVEPIRNFFAAFFLASIGMLIHVQFLWNHIDILLAAVIMVVVIKTFVVATVVKGFRYTNKTALLVGMSLAQIGEFAFVLLSRASNLHLIEGKLYLLLGTTALSLVTTPFLFKLIPAVVHLGVLLRWFTPDMPTEVLFKELKHSDMAKRISVMADASHDL